MISLKTFGGDGYNEIGSHVNKTNDGGFIITIGSDSNFGSGNIDSLCSMGGDRSIFIKYNADVSVLEWSKCYLGSGDTGFGYIFPQDDGGFVLGGQYNSDNGWGFYICKQDATGSIVWSHGYSKGDGPLLFDMINTDDGGYIMFGEAYYIDTNTTIHYGSSLSADLWVLKLDSLGNKVWSKVIGGSSEEAAHKVAAAPNNGCYIVGFTSSNDYDCTGNHGGNSGSNDVYLARLDMNGNILWHKDLGGTSNDGGKYGWPDGNGGIVIGAISGSHDGDVSNHIGSDICMWALDVDSNSNVLWNNCYGNGNNEDLNAICQSIDGSIWIAGVSGAKGGEIDNAYGMQDAWFVHADGTGNFLNAKVLGSSLDDGGMMVYPLSSGNIIAGGFYSWGDGTFIDNIYYGSLGSNDNAFLALFEPKTTAVNTIPNSNNGVRLYPNPAKDYVTIETAVKGNYEINIYDVIGQLVYNTSFINQTKIAVNELVSGMYYVQAIAENGNRSVQKLIVK